MSQTVGSSVALRSYKIALINNCIAYSGKLASFFFKS
jgi:hypothetical protein